MKSNTGKIKIGHIDLCCFQKPINEWKTQKQLRYVFFAKYMIDKDQITNILKENADNENEI
jgi:hypothetical protein